MAIAVELDPVAVESHRRNGSDPLHGYRVEIDEKTKKPSLPEVPPHNDRAALCAWLTCVFNLDVSHPVTGAEHRGPRGPEGQVYIRRAGAPDVVFEPASRINGAGKLTETLAWYLLPIDGAIHAFGSEHCRTISYVIRMLCGAYDALTEKQEAAAIVGDFLLAAVPVEEFTTYGTGPQRYEAAIALRREIDQTTGRPIGQAHYLIDAGSLDESTGELVGAGEIVIAVSDLQETARRHVGSSLRRGWLDGRMQTLGWRRVCLDGHELPGRSGRQGHHATVNAYRGHMPTSSDPDEAAETVEAVTK